MVITQEAKSVELSSVVQQQIELKQRLIDFVMDADDEVAIALEAFSAQQLSRWAKPTLSGLNRSELAVDMFVTEGTATYEKNNVATKKSITQVFVESENELSPNEKDSLSQWASSFNGLFAIKEQEDQQYVLMNWLTQKKYVVFTNSQQAEETLKRLSVGEMMIARLMPISNEMWTFSGPLTLLGKLGKPKLAVAVGNFRQWFPEHLYGDAPELKEAAWESVKEQYDDFVDLFGGKRVVMSGYELNKKLQTYQEQSTEKKLSEAGLDSSKSVKELAQEAGVSKEEVAEAVESLGTEGKVAATLLDSQKSLKMVMPKLELPEEIRRAEDVVAIAHPRWGQLFLKDLARLEALLKENNNTEAVDKLVAKHLEQAQAVLPVWQQLVAEYSEPLEQSLRRVLKNDEFVVKTDLEGALTRYGKSLIPTLPDTASVPVHLHELFQAALKAVGKDAKKSGGKKKKKAKKSGFGV